MATFSEFERVIQNKKYKEFIFTEYELLIIENKPFHKQLEFLAGRFCAKEAIAKALGTGFLQDNEVRWKDIEIGRDEKGAPIVKLYRNAKTVFLNKKYKQIKLSISHKNNVVICMALVY